MDHESKKKEWSKITIGTREYAFEDIPGEEAVFLSLKLLNVFGSAFCGLLGESDGSGLDVMVSRIASGVNPTEAMGIFKAVIPRTFVNEGGSGHRATFDDFQGRTIEFYKVMFACIRYNFADFFAEGPLSGLAQGVSHA